MAKQKRHRHWTALNRIYTHGGRCCPWLIPEDVADDLILEGLVFVISYQSGQAILELTADGYQARRELRGD